MDKMLVVGFDSELKAYEGARALQELQKEGAIDLYAKAVIARDAGGKVTVKDQGDMGPVGTAVGLLTGSLIGLIGGPVGVAVGATAGTYGGLLYDSMSLGINVDFIDEVADYLQPGKAAVVAEVWEEWVLPVDHRMEALGGIVFRRSRNEVLDIVIDRDVRMLNADLDALEAEYDQASTEAKADLQKKIDAAKAKLQATQGAMQERIDASRKETDAKIKLLQEKAAKGSAEQKAKHEARIAELQAEQARRSELLNQAWELTKEALSA